MKPSDTESDTKLNIQKTDTNLDLQYSTTYLNTKNSDINDIRFASIQIRDNPPSSNDDMITSILPQKITNHNNPIPINPWQDMTSSSNTTNSEKNSIYKNNVDNKHQHYSGALLSNHELNNTTNNNNSTLWNRNTNTVL